MDTVLHPPALDGQFLKVSNIKHGPKVPRCKILNFFNTLENNRENNLWKCWINESSSFLTASTLRPIQSIIRNVCIYVYIMYICILLSPRHAILFLSLASTGHKNNWSGDICLQMIGTGVTDNRCHVSHETYNLFFLL